VRRETGRGNDRFKIQDLADAGCSQAVPDFLSVTVVGRRVPSPAEEDAQTETSEYELRRGRKGTRPRRLVPRTRNSHVSSHALLHGLGRGGVGVRAVFFRSFLCLSFVIFLVRSTLLGTDLRQKEELQRAACGLVEVGRTVDCLLSL